MTQIPEHGAALSGDKLALLKLLLQEEGLDGVAESKIQPRHGSEPIPLSFAQERLWFLNQLEPGNPTYNIPLAILFTGLLDTAALRSSLNKIIERHESLRTIFVAVDGYPSQVIIPSMTLELPVVDLQHLPKTERECEITQLTDEVFHHSFDLSKGPLLRVMLLRLKPAEHVLLFNTHHIVADAWSLDVFFRELTNIYKTHTRNMAFPLVELPVQYADYVIWQRRWLQGPVWETQLSYWKEQLSGELPVLMLPTDRHRPTVQTFRGKGKPFTVPQMLINPLRALGRQVEATLFMTLLAAFNVLLYRYTGQEDILVGTPIANRKRVEVEELIGFFTNTLVMRTSVVRNPTFKDLLMRVRDMALMAYEHQDMPFERLVEALQPERSLDHNPLFQVMFVFEQTKAGNPEWLGLTSKPLEMDSQTSKFDLTLFVVDEEENLRGWLEFNTDLFDEETIDRMLGHFQALLEGIVSNPEQRLSALPLLTDVERHQMVVAWNNTQVQFEAGSTHQLFERQVDQTPDNAAVVFGDKSLTYHTLNRRANQLAHYLQKQGVGPEVLVAIYVERSLDMMIGLLGVLKAGGGYVPLDINYPKKRLHFMLQDTGASLLLTQRHLADQLSFQGVTICLDSDWNIIAQETDINPTIVTEPHHLAYVMYTSGSTGVPKGVMIQHGSLSNYLNWAVQAYPFTEGRAVPVHSSIGFDLTISSLFPPLLVGQSVKLLPESTGVNMLSASLIDEGDFSLIKITPSHLSLLNQLLPAEKALNRTHAFVIGGEQLTIEHISFWRRHAPDTRLFNEYGPTETVVGCCVYEVPPGDESPQIIPIGRPIANTQLYILDNYLNPVPMGVVGELYIGGAGVARGYLNQPQLTAESFIPDPFSEDLGARLYATGDQARYLPDGNIQYIGRVDAQVKIRGYRIELGEIEAVLNRHPAVYNSVVVIREDEPDNKRLVANIVSYQEESPSTDELSRYLKKRLPAYMVPSAYVFLDTLPLTSSRKIDRQALPIPELAHSEMNNVATSGRKDEVEAQMIRIWEELLQTRPIGLTDDFFELGGHSLMAVRLFAKIEQEFRTNLPLTSLFQEATIQHLVNLIKQQRGHKTWSSLVELQPWHDHTQLPFYCVHGITGDVLWFGDLARHINDDQPFYGLQSRGLDGVQQPLTTIEEMAAHYISEIRTFQTDGPYFLGGYSYGAHVAYEMACQLYEQGQEVGLLVILDTFALLDIDETATRFDAVVNALGGLFYRGQEFIRLPPRQMLVRLRRKVKAVIAELKGRFDPSKKSFELKAEHMIDNADLLPPHMQRLIEINSEAMAKYVPQSGYRGPITLFRAKRGHLFRFYGPKMGWEHLVRGDINIGVVKGSHVRIFQEPHIKELADQLNEAIEKAQKMQKKIDSLNVEVGNV